MDCGVKKKERERETKQSYPSRLDLLHVQGQQELGDALQPHPLLGHPQVAHALLRKEERRRGDEFRNLLHHEKKYQKVDVF